MANSDNPNPNTQFLVSEIQNEQKRTKIIGAAVLAVVLGALGWFLFIKEPAPDPLQHGAAGASGAPTAAPSH